MKKKASTKGKAGSSATAETGTGAVSTAPEPSAAAPRAPSDPLADDAADYRAEFAVPQDVVDRAANLLLDPIPFGGEDETMAEPAPMDEETAKENAASFARAGALLVDAAELGETIPTLPPPIFHGTGIVQTFDPLWVVTTAFGKPSFQPRQQQPPSQPPSQQPSQQPSHPQRLVDIDEPRGEAEEEALLGPVKEVAEDDAEDDDL